MADVTAPRPVAAWDENARPRQRAGIELRVVTSPREGTRHVLADRERGRYLELRGGERDALVWAGLDGTRSLREIGLALVESTGSFPRDLGRFVARLEAEGFLEGEGRPVPTPPARGSLAGRILRVFVPLPGVGGLIGGPARSLRFLGSTYLFALLALAGLAGAAVASGLSLRGTLVPAPEVLLPGLAALLGVNALVALLESFGSALALSGAGGEVRRAGLVFTAAIPEPAVDLADEAVVPVEGRTLARAAPLAVSLFLGGGAALAIWALERNGLANDARVLAAMPWLVRLVWIGLLRTLLHANPLGPSALYDALGAWFHLEDLRGAARRFFAHDLVQQIHHRAEEPVPLSRRDHVLLFYGALSLAWLVLAARVVANVVLVEALPRIEPLVRAWVLGSGSRSSGATPFGTEALGVVALLLVVLLPLAIVASSLVLALARAVARGVARSTLGTPRGAGIAAALVAAAVAAGALPFTPSEGALLAAGVSALAAWLALRASNTDGRGQSATGLTLAAVASGFAAVSVLLIADMGVRGSAAETVKRVVSGTRRAQGLALLAAALVELASVKSAVRLVGLAGAFVAAGLAVACVAGAFSVGLLPQVPALEMSGPAAALLGGIVYLASAVLSLGSFRPPSRFLLGAAALVLALEQAVAMNGRFQLLRPTEQELCAQVLAVLWPGLVAAGAIARSAERRVRSYVLPLDLVEPSATETETLDALLAPLAETVREHLGVGAAVSVGREVASSAGQGVAERALVMLKGCRGVAGERYLARYLEAALERAPSISRAALAKKLEPVPALADLAQRIAEGCEPDLATRGGLFRSVPILSPLSDEDVFELAALAIQEKVPTGQFVVREGEEGDRFYAILKGSAEVTVHGKDGIERTVAHLHEGDAFGEAALLRHEPRSASVRATTDLELLAVGRDVFLEFIKPRSQLLARIVDRLEDVWLLRSTALFAELESAQVVQLFQRCFDVSVPAGVAIVRQGERGDRFYIIREGEVTVEVDEGKGRKRVVAHLARGDYFGEMALLHDAPRAATVVAQTPVELVGLGREDFLRLMRGEARLKLEQASQARGRALGGEA